MKGVWNVGKSFFRNMFNYDVESSPVTRSLNDWVGLVDCKYNRGPWVDCNHGLKGAIPDDVRSWRSSGFDDLFGGYGGQWHRHGRKDSRFLGTKKVIKMKKRIISKVPIIGRIVD